MAIDNGKIDRKLVDHICLIAKLDLTEDERERYAKQLNEVLSAFRVLDEVKVDDARMAFHPVPVENVWRDDKIIETPWEPLAGVKNKEDGYFKGPRIV